MKNILIIVQARISSTRLPAKVLKEINNKPLLWYVIKRLEQVKTPNKVIIATGHLKINQPIIDFAKNNNFYYFVGDEEDVLDRYYNSAKEFNGDIIVRITSDCPLIEANLIDKLLEIYLNGECDYLSNVHPPTYPDGYDTEIFSFEALEMAWKKAKLQSEREHVTPYIWKNESNEFIIKNFENNVDLSQFRLTIDTQEDFLLISKIIENFHDKLFDFQMDDVFNFLKNNKELLKINIQYKRDEGYIKSLEEDKEFLKGEKEK